ncbi:MAG: SNF2 helicase associated domain-containing protein, partial [Blautia sp.]|nr:SNF2 helicase associated domain-containing protein [Blautia sp.]
MSELDAILAAYESEEIYRFSDYAFVDFAFAEFDRRSVDYIRLIKIASKPCENTRKAVLHPTLVRQKAAFRPLQGSIDLCSSNLLGFFYNIAQGETVFVKGYGDVRFEHIKPEINITPSPLLDMDGKFQGASLQGKMTPCYENGEHIFLFDEGCLSKATEEEADVLRHFLVYAEKDGLISSTVDNSHFSYLVQNLKPLAPLIIDESFFSYMDYLYTNPIFSFRLEKKSKAFFCSITVYYGETDISLPVHENRKLCNFPRDIKSEMVAMQTVKRFFPQFMEKSYSLMATEENTQALFTTIIPALKKMGYVSFLPGFPTIRRASLQGLCFSLTLEKRDLFLKLLCSKQDQHELLRIIRARKEGKEFMLGKGGDLLDLRDNQALADIQAVYAFLDKPLDRLDDMRLSFPSCYAPFLNWILSTCQEVPVKLGDEVEDLLKRFALLQELCTKQEDVRLLPSETPKPFRCEGAKWLSTLYEVSPGAVLTDETGLDKPFEVLAFLNQCSRKEKKGTYLIICPASRLCSWKDAVQENLTCFQVWANTDMLEDPVSKTQNPKDHSLHLVSIDFLRHHQEYYEKIPFDVIVMDEAQMIKNSTAATRCAVKSLHGRFHLAVTGTPIENSLQDLWYIFDIAMPGYLFSKKDFTRRFETPIMKKNDKTARKALKEMIAPFLIRLKGGFLTELPLKQKECSFVERMKKLQYRYQLAQMFSLQEIYDGSKAARISLLKSIIRLRQIHNDLSLFDSAYSG